MKTTHKKTLEQKNFNDLPSTAFMPKPLNNLFLNSKQYGFNIHALRIMAVILLRLKQEQLRTSKEVTLFENEWLTEKDESESVLLKFLMKDFIPIGSKNYKCIIEALDYLSQSIKTEYVNNLGENIVLTDNILGYSYNKNKKGIHITMRGYWYKKFIDLSRTSNGFPKSIIFKLSSINSVSFYFWLKTVPLTAHPQLTIENINSKFNTAYKHLSDIERKLLAPLKEEYDISSDLSFSYTLSDNKATINPYETTNTIPEVYSKEEYSVSKAIAYKQKKYLLSEIETALLEDLYLRYSYKVVHNSSVRKKELVKLKGREYLDQLAVLVQYYIKNRLKPYEVELLSKSYSERKLGYNKKFHS